VRYLLFYVTFLHVIKTEYQHKYNNNRLRCAC